MFVRSIFNYDTDEVSLATGYSSDMPTMTQQQFKDECDINTIAKNFGMTGRLPSAIYAPTYGDFTDVEDFQGALHAIQEASNAFMLLPANVRERFQHDPAKLVEFCSDSRNADEMAELGLSKQAPKPIPAAPQPVTPTPTSPT